jgi:hypothetical protein
MGNQKEQNEFALTTHLTIRSRAAFPTVVSEQPARPGEHPMMSVDGPFVKAAVAPALLTRSSKPFCAGQPFF